MRRIPVHALAALTVPEIARTETDSARAAERRRDIMP
jgi:hypothetical protein